jgi:hypothetical protein
MKKPGSSIGGNQLSSIAADIQVYWDVEIYREC